MKSVGLITEYNPFHNGHLFHLNRAKEITQAECAIAVMSGDFVQRGEPAIIDKYSRTKAAVDAGVNLVIELPVVSALSSAEGFASGAIQQLNTLGVDSIVFGSECGDIQKLAAIADILIDETPEYKSILMKAIAAGNSFPAAREIAVRKILESNSNSPSLINSANTSNAFKEEKVQLTDILSSPNNILGIEYIKAIKKMNASITPITIQREGTGYNQIQINGLPSASAIRAQYCGKTELINTESLKNQLPESMFQILTDTISKQYQPITIDDFSLLFHIKMNEIIYSCHCNKSAIIEQLCACPDINEDFAARIYNAYKGREPLSSYCQNVKSKQYTYSRISRTLMHIILGLTTESKANAKPYIRILGFDDIGAQYLSSIRKTCSVPLITKVSDHTDLLINDIFCSHIYNEVVYNKCGYRIPDEYRAGIYKKCRE